MNEFGILGGSVGVLFDDGSVGVHVYCRVDFVGPVVFLFDLGDKRRGRDSVSDSGSVLRCNGLVLDFELDANVWENWDFGSGFVAVLFLVASRVAIGVHV